MAEYIEREALLKHAHIGMTRVSDTEWQKGYWDGVDHMAEYIREQPTADVAEVKHGYWDDNIIGFCNVCMECGAIVERTAVKSHTGKLNYCPNCGARMDGEGE